jgi:hypothetical protein
MQKQIDSKLLAHSDRLSSFSFGMELNGRRWGGLNFKVSGV